MRTTKKSHSGLSFPAMLALFAMSVVAGLVVVTASPGSKGQSPVASATTSDVLSRLPVVFEPNRGQSSPNVHFLARTIGYTAFLLSDGIALRQGSCSNPTRLIFAGNRRPSIPRAVNQLPGRSNYYPSSDPSTWHEDIPQYSRIEYPGMYPGVDVAVRGVSGELEYDWIVAAGADPQAIEVRFEPAESVRVDGEGDLIVDTACGLIRQRLPLAYQEVRGQRKPVDVNYAMRSSNAVGISVGGYDHTLPLVIDPSISIAVLLASSGGSPGLGGSTPRTDSAAGIALGQDGSIYITGIAYAVDFPQTVGTAPGGCFVVRLSASGSMLLYSTVLPATCSAVAADTLGNAYVTGGASTGLVVTGNAFQPMHAGLGDAFLSKLNPAGALLYSSYLGGRFGDSGSAIAVDSSGNIFVAGGTSSPDFPTTPGAFQRTCALCDGGTGDGFIAKFSNDGTTLLASTLLGGANSDPLLAGAVDATGNVYVTGWTRSPDFPTTAGAFQTTFVSGIGFVTKLNPALSALVYSTFLGGTGGGYGIAVDSAGSAYVTGAAGADFPLVNPLQPRAGVFTADAFVTKFSPDGSRLLYSTYLGGTGDDLGYAIAVDPSGAIYVTGQTYSADFPQVDPIQAEINGGHYTSLDPGRDAFVAKIRPDGSALVYSTFFGGTQDDVGKGIAADAQGNAYVTGAWGRAAFPSTALSELAKSSGGAFILKIAPTGSTPLISARRVTNGASFQTGRANGGIATVFGKGIVNVSGIMTASTLPLPTELNGVAVLIDGVRMPLFAIANVNGQEQINFQVQTTGFGSVSVVNNGAQAVPVLPYGGVAQPGIFTTDGSTGAIQHGSTYQLVTASNPAKRGEVLVIYATGLGLVTPEPGLGNPALASPPSQTVVVPTATIGGVAAQVLFSGLAPGFVGLNQVNVVVPQGTASGTVNVVLTSGNVSSPAVTLAVDSSPANSQAADSPRRQQ